MGRDREDREIQLGELVYGYKKPHSVKDGRDGAAGGGRARSESVGSDKSSVDAATGAADSGVEVGV